MLAESVVISLIGVFAIVSIYRRSQTLVDLRILTIGSFLYFFAVPPILAGISEDAALEINRFSFTTETQTAFMLAMPIAFAALLFGLALSSSRGSASANRAVTVARFSSSRLFLLGVFFTLLGNYAAYKQLTVDSSSIFGVLEGSSSYIVARTGAGIWGTVSSVAPVGATALLMWTLSQRWNVLGTRTILTGVILIVSMGPFVLLTVRQHLFITLIALVILFENRLRPRLRVVLGLTMGVAALALFFYLSFLRSASYGGSDFSRLTYRSFDFTNSTMEVIEQVQEDGYLYGEHALDPFIFLVPRAFWDDKPRTSTINRTYFPRAAAVQTERRPGIIAEAYTIYGLIAVPVLLCFWGFCVGSLQRWLNRKGRGSLTYVLMGPPIAALMYKAIRNGVFDKYQIGVGIMVGLAWFLIRLSRATPQKANGILDLQRRDQDV